MDSPVEALLMQAWPPQPWADVGCLIAVSGGADSVALLRAMLAVRPPGALGRLVVGHFNHRLRTAADDDEQFVVDLCRAWDTPCEVGRAESSLVENAPNGVEAAAREQRYQFLLDAAQRHGARWVVTAHTADDQVETVLHRIVRGTGVEGLCGIPRCRPLSEAVVLARPLLDVTRAEVLTYLQGLGQSYREDESNQSVAFTRNQIRHELLPLLRERFNPSIDRAVLRLGSLAEEYESLLTSQVESLWPQLVQESPHGVVLDWSTVTETSSLLLRAVLKRVWAIYGWDTQEMGYIQWRDLERMILQRAPKRSLPDRVWAESQETGFAIYRTDADH